MSPWCYCRHKYMCCVSVQGLHPLKDPALVNTSAVVKWNRPASLGVLKHSEFISLELGDQAELLKNNPTPESPSTKLYTWHSAVRQVPFSWSIRLPDGEAINHSRERLHCSTVQWQRALHHCIRHFALCWCLAWMQLLGHGNTFHEALCTLS